MKYWKAVDPIINDKLHQLLETGDKFAKRRKNLSRKIGASRTRVAVYASTWAGTHIAGFIFAKGKEPDPKLWKCTQCADGDAYYPKKLEANKELLAMIDSLKYNLHAQIDKLFHTEPRVEVTGTGLIQSGYGMRVREGLVTKKQVYLSTFDWDEFVPPGCVRISDLQWEDLLE